MAPRINLTTKETPERIEAKRIKGLWNIASANVRMLEASLEKARLAEIRARAVWVAHCEVSPEAKEWDERIVRIRTR